MKTALDSRHRPRFAAGRALPQKLWIAVAALSVAGANAGAAGRDDPAWQQGRIEVRSRPGMPVGAGADVCEQALKRADLALANDNRIIWAQQMAVSVRRGCDADAVEQRLVAAERAEAGESRRRDAAIAAAVRRDRPEVYAAAGRRSAGRAIEPAGSDRSDGGWSAVVTGLTELLAARKAQRDAAVYSRPAASRTSGRDSVRERVYADIFADDQDGQAQTNPRANDVPAGVDAAAEVARLLGRQGSSSPPPGSSTQTRPAEGPAPASPGFGSSTTLARRHEPAEARATRGSGSRGAGAAQPASWQEQVEQIESKRTPGGEFDMGAFDDF